MRYLYYIRNVKSKDDERTALGILKKQKYKEAHDFRDVFWQSRLKRGHNIILICDDCNMPEYSDELDIKQWTDIYRSHGYVIKELLLDPTNIGDL